MKAQISRFLRKVNLIFFADKVRFYLLKRKLKKDNLNFRQEQPHFILPPDYLIYESFQISYRRYHNSGKSAAIWLRDVFGKYSDSQNTKILDWGCGPARVVRHLPSVFGNGVEVFGTDYNSESINWNKQNIENVSFNLNFLEAKLPYKNDFFDFVYGISIFTHLSEKMHYAWVEELKRILKPQGILLLTLQGDEFIKILNFKEKNDYNNGKLVVRGHVKEGHRTYSTFHPTKFVENLFNNFEILEHKESYSKDGNPQQDIWIFRKR